MTTFMSANRIVTAAFAFAGGLVAGILLAPRTGSETRGLIAEEARGQLKGMAKQLRNLEAQVSGLSDQLKSASGEFTDKVRTASGELSGKVKSASGELGSKVKSASEELGSKVKSASEDLGSKVKSASEDLTEKVKHATVDQLVPGDPEDFHVDDKEIAADLRHLPRK